MQRGMLRARFGRLTDSLALASEDGLLWRVRSSGPLALVCGAAALSLAFVAVSLASPGGVRRLVLLRRDVARAEAVSAALRARNAELARTVQQLSGKVDPKALERAARQQLGFVRQDELLFKFE
jgi:cell division protein FtsB